jgi:small subunit ribosomal protein S20
MAHSRSAKKRIRQNLARRKANRAVVSALKTQVKKVRKAVEAKDAAAAAAEFRRLQKLADKAAKTNRIHRNKASRLKSRLGGSIAALAPAKA